MPYRKSKRKTAVTLKKKPRIELHAGLILGAGLFLWLCFLNYRGQPMDQEIIGWLGTKLAVGMELLFGQAAVLFPVILLLWAAHMFYNRTYWGTRITGVILLYLAGLIYFGLYDLLPGLEFWEGARSGFGSGYIGGSLTWLLLKLTGRIGANLIMVMLALSSLIIIINRPLLELLLKLKNSLSNLMVALEEMIFYEEEPKISEPVIVGGKETRTAEVQVFEEPAQEPVVLIEETRPMPPTVRKPNSSDYIRPSLELLSSPEPDRVFNKSDIKESIKILEDTFANFNIKIKVNQVSCGPSVTRYELQPAPGVKVSKILSLADDLQLSLAAAGIRIEAPIPGKSAVGIEVPNERIARVGLRNIMSSNLFVESTHPLTVALGEDVSGNPVVANLAEMPHLLIAGATGSGKSVCLNSIIISLLYKASPEELKLVLIDPKMVELTAYNGIPHLMVPVVTDPKKAALVLRWMLNEMDKRYKMFSQEGVRDIYRYNEINEQRLPFIVVVIDELADLMMVSPVDVEDSICRLAQMARAAGIHLVVATQRPSVDVVTGIIKANIPSRIAFAVSSQSDSRTILDTGGAEKLLGRGDMLFFPVGASKPIRVQGGFVSDAELERVVEFLKDQAVDEQVEAIKEWETSLENEAEFEMDDELFWEAVRIFVETQRASVSLLQRKLRIGYARAARLVDMMEERGIISEPDINKKRDVLIDHEQLEQLTIRQCF